jgi:predicted transcriptional regulator
MAVAPTSIENYHEHKRSGKLSHQEQQIVDFLKAHWSRNWSRLEIARDTGLPVASVCGRVNKLVDEGYVEPDPKRPCSITGKTVSPVRISRAHITKN